MPKQSFASLIISQLKGAIGTDGSAYNSGTPSAANSAIAQAVTQYLITNTKITIAYTGTMPTGSPDICTDNVLVTGSVAPPSGTDFQSWLKSLESNIVAGIMISSGPGLVTPTGTFPAFIPGISNPDLYGAIGDYNNSAQQIAWEAICDSILTWLNSIVTSPYAATHVTSTGMASPTKTTVI